MISSESVLMDCDCYVTVMNLSNQRLVNMTYQINAGSGFSAPGPPRTIGPKNSPNPDNYEASFVLSDSLTEGSAAEITYTFDEVPGSITFTFSCPNVFYQSNSANCTQTVPNVGVQFFGSTTPVVWAADGSNWGPVNQIPSSDHPLYVLFVLSRI